MWYKKRKDATAEYIAAQCGMSTSLSAVGDILHSDDLEELRVNLFNVTKHTISLLFEETEI